MGRNVEEAVHLFIYDGGEGFASRRYSVSSRSLYFPLHCYIAFIGSSCIPAVFADAIRGDRYDEDSNGFRKRATVIEQTEID